MIDILFEKVDELIWVSHNFRLGPSWSRCGIILKSVDNLFVKPTINGITYHVPFERPILIIVKKVIGKDAAVNWVVVQFVLDLIKTLAAERPILFITHRFKNVLLDKFWVNLTPLLNYLIWRHT